MSNITGCMPQDVFVGRSDPVYMAHAYLTKVPVAAIEPFIEAFTRPGDTVVDPFAGSGMTGVAAAALGRKAQLFDISVLGQHIGENYVNLVDPGELRDAAEAALSAVVARLGDVYSVRCRRCLGRGRIAKRVWSVLVECPRCHSAVNYYEALKIAGWQKGRMVCSDCATSITSKARRIAEEPVLDYINCSCSSVQIDQPPTEPIVPLKDLSNAVPDVAIGSDRQMYKAQALGRNGHTTIASYYSQRNLAFLAALREAIQMVSNDRIKRKLLFCFTSILTRASKRYQWSIQRPLNAANANYYIAPVFYEWNVGDLFARKVDAALRSDEWLRERQGRSADGLFGSIQPDVYYSIASADAIPLPDNSADYVFMDPPFGSNLFYADMALFQEAWLGRFTNVDLEAVIDRGQKKVRTALRYEQLLTKALSECRRIVRPGGWITMVFGNSTGAVWALVQRAVRESGLVIEPGSVSILNKGQRSVKGLASGFEHVATMDLILSMHGSDANVSTQLRLPDEVEIEDATNCLLQSREADSPSHLYLELLRYGLRHDWDLSGIDLRDVTRAVRKSGLQIAATSGRFMARFAAELQQEEIPGIGG